jgi:hypothetical protein
VNRRILKALEWTLVVGSVGSMLSGIAMVGFLIIKHQVFNPLVITDMHIISTEAMRPGEELMIGYFIEPRESCALDINRYLRFKGLGEQNGEAEQEVLHLTRNYVAKPRYYQTYLTVLPRNLYPGPWEIYSRYRIECDGLDNNWIVRIIETPHLPFTIMPRALW